VNLPQLMTLHRRLQARSPLRATAGSSSSEQRLPALHLSSSQQQRAALVRATAMLAVTWIAFLHAASSARGESASAPAILQIFEAKWETIEDRMADIHNVGYGQLWLPPPARADTGGLSVGYDVFDRFDLGKPRNETLYGTETGLKTIVAAAHRAGVSVYTDFIPNHNGFGDSNDAPFVTLGGYPGFALKLPSDSFGDFHNPSDGGDLQGQLAGLADIAQEKNHQFIRHATTPGDPRNIPAGTVFNKPDPNNARFYPDQALGGLPLSDPELGAMATRYTFNAANPQAGDPVEENATGLLMRNAHWMIEVIGVDGFRVDAVKHFPEIVMDYLDQATFRANPRLNLDGSIKPTFMFSELLTGDMGFIQNYIRKDLPSTVSIDPANTTVGGNRDALDFPLFFAMRNNLTGNGLQNNWHHIRNASQDTQDDGLRNGSQGVSFVDSHDNLPGGFPFLKNVAYAYTLLRPGNAIVYLNAEQFGTGRDFPNDGRVDALGGFYGETIAKLVELRNSHGRGDFHERWVDDAFNPNGFSNIYVYERSDSAVVGLSSRNDSFVETRNGVQTNFDPNMILVELTGNANDPTVDPTGAIRQTLRVNGAGQINLSIPSNAGHGRGYVVYGLAPPQGALSLANVAATLPGATPAAANNGTARLAGIDVITANSFNVSLNTTPVSLVSPDGPTENSASLVRDVHADGDTALIKIDGGVNLNNLPGIDHVTPGSVVYGFEEFTGVRSPGYVHGGGANVGTGFGAYTQTIDATQLAEGRHYITVRAFRHRDAATGGDGGPSVFTDFTKTIYVDRLKPEAQVVSFAPFASSPGTLQNRDLVVRSTDGTADNMHFFLDLPANVTDAQIRQMVNNGQGDAGDYDRDSFISGYFGLKTGNHVATVVTFEPTGNSNIQRFAGLFTTGLGAGFGDLNSNGAFTASDLLGTSNGSFEQVLYSQNSLFNAAADVDADGRVTNLDLFALGDHLTAAGANAAALTAYDQLLAKRGDINQDGVTNGADVSALHNNFGSTTWLHDLNVDGTVNIADVDTLVTELVRTSRGDFNLDRVVDGADLLVWQRNLGAAGARFDQGDASLNGSVGGDDLALWESSYGTTGPIAASAGAAAVPEPTPWSLTITAALVARSLTVCHRTQTWGGRSSC
jgi:glycosidase